MKTPGWILTILLSILMAAVLELNQNTLFGWLLFSTFLSESAQPVALVRHGDLGTSADFSDLFPMDFRLLGMDALSQKSATPVF